MADFVNVSQALSNLSALFDSLRELTIAISYITGVALIFRGVALYRAFGQHITMQSRGGEVAGPMVFIIVGAFLVYLPSTIDNSLVTVFGSTDLSTASSILSLSAGTDNNAFEEVTNVISKYLSLIGLIAFVRGWIILSKMGHSGSQPGSVAKGITHIIGGIFLLNIVETVRLIAQLFGFEV